MMSAGRKDEERRILKVQRLNTELLRDISTQTSTPEKVAWMIFWTRSVLAADTTLASFDPISEMSLAVLQRMCLEMELQLRVITEPVMKKKSARGDVEWREVKNRFRAYTAWCLWADMSLLEDILHPKNMDSVCDTSAARKVLADPKKRKLWEEHHWGGKELYEGAKGVNRAELERYYKAKLRGVRELLDDSSLAFWVRKLEGRPPSFFALFNEDERSVCRRLNSMGIRFAYSLYSRGSMMIHGNSLDHFLRPPETTEKLLVS